MHRSPNAFTKNSQISFLVVRSEGRERLSAGESFYGRRGAKQEKIKNLVSRLSAFYKEAVRIKVKICGITRLEDALAAAAAGADALGFNFYEGSPRRLTIQSAAEISRQLPSSIMRVGVFINAPEKLVAQAIGECGLSLLQFHGDESPEFCVQFGLMSMKAFRVRDAESLKELPKYSTDAFLLDAWAPEIRGGTGQKFNWALALEAQKLGKPIFLAGGLTPENVAEAVRQVKPYGVDVASGVERSPGKKDHDKMRKFIAQVRWAEGK